MVYRCLEMISQHLLVKHGINPKKPDYSVLDDAERFERRINEIGEQIYPNFRTFKLKYMTNNISLMQGLIMLRALDEQTTNHLDFKDLQEYIILRNKSRLVHGFDLLEEETVETFYHIVRSLNNRVWNEYGNSVRDRDSFKSFMERFDFLNIHVPNYYLGNE